MSVAGFNRCLKARFELALWVLCSCATMTRVSVRVPFFPFARCRTSTTALRSKRSARSARSITISRSGGAEDCGEVEEGAGDARDRDPVEDGEVLRVEDAGAVDANPADRAGYRRV